MSLQQGSEVWAISTPAEWNRALLLFDRVWVPPVYLMDNFPDAMAFADPGLDDAIHYQSGHAHDVVRYFERNSPRFEGREPNRFAVEYADSEGFFGRAIRRVADRYSKAGYRVVPLYPSCATFEHEFSNGLDVAYEAALDAIFIVCPESLTLAQVLEFRRDSEAVRKYRALRLWLRDGLKARSVSEATDTILSKVGNYEWSIRKHGLKTLTGSMSAVLDSKMLVALTSGAALGHLIAGPIWAALAAGLVASSRCLVWLADRRIDLEDVKRGPDSEVAVIYDLKARFSRG